MQNKSPFQIEIPRRGSVCFKGQETFQVGLDYHSVIIDDPETGLKRFDFCETCWENGSKKEWLSLAKTSWKSRVPEKKMEPDLFKSQDAKMMDLLKQLLNSPNPEEQIECFIISLYLARKKILYHRQQMKDEEGQLIDLYEIAETEEMIGIRKIPLNQIDVSKVQKEIMAKLKV